MSSTGTTSCTAILVRWILFLIALGVFLRVLAWVF